MVAILSEELLARFVLYARWIRADKTVRSDAFFPPPDGELSVTRHVGLTDLEIWQAGQAVSVERTLPLLGRADFSARVPRDLNLDVAAKEPPRNHAVVRGWPVEKSEKMILAQKIAAKASFVPPPILSHHE